MTCKAQRQRLAATYAPGDSVVWKAGGGDVHAKVERIDRDRVWIRYLGPRPRDPHATRQVLVHPVDASTIAAEYGWPH